MGRQKVRQARDNPSSHVSRNVFFGDRLQRSFFGPTITTGASQLLGKIGSTATHAFAALAAAKAKEDRIAKSISDTLKAYQNLIIIVPSAQPFRPPRMLNIQTRYWINSRKSKVPEHGKAIKKVISFLPAGTVDKKTKSENYSGKRHA